MKILFKILNCSVMNVEVQKKTLRLNESYEFIFSGVVLHYIVGYSGFNLEFESLDHHVREISIDVRSSNKQGQKVTVKPHFVLCDHHTSHKTSEASKIDIVVLAIIGQDNPNLYIRSHYIIDGLKYIPENDITFFKTALSYSNVEYEIDEDHHVQKFLSYIYPSIKSSVIEIKTGTSIIDRELNFIRGETSGSVIYYVGNDKNILCAEYNSKKIGKSGQVSFGMAPENFSPDNYIVASFISEFSLSFDKPNDHHVKKLEVSSSFQDLYLNNGEINTRVNLKSYITDRHYTEFDIPHNEVSGFLIAIKKNVI